MRLTIVMALIACLRATGVAQNLGPSSSTELFEKIKSLNGTWVGHSERGGDTTLEYRVVARGSAVLEEYAETSPEGDVMETVYYLENDQLMLRHFCVAKNQPVMKAAAFDSKDRKLVFEFVDGTNMKPQDGHMHRIWLQFVDQNTLVNGAAYYKNEKPLFSESTIYKRRPN